MSADRVPRTATLLRALAVTIAMAGAIDPGVTRARATTPHVALLHAGTRDDSVTAVAVRAHLRATGIHVVDAMGPGDAARVVVGSELPPLDTTPVPAFVYAPSSIAVTQVTVPARVRLTSQVPVSITLHAVREAEAMLELLDASVVVARDRVRLRADSAATRTLLWAPPSLGTHALTVRVTTTDGVASTRITRAVLVDSSRWRVLAYDARPTWTATFLRRTLVRDARFEVRSRVVTARAPQALVARGTSRTPVSLSALDPRSVDVLVVGGPEALPSAELAALRRLVASDGVPLVLLPDDASPRLAQWLDVSGWRTAPRREPVAVRVPGGMAADSLPALRALVVAAPSRLPPGSDTLLALDAQPVVWRQPLGVGDVVVSGALDAWRFRDDAQSGFDRLWRDVVAAQAARRAPALTVWPEALSVRPAARRSLTITSVVPPRVTWVPERGAAVALAVAPTAAPTTWTALTPSTETGHGAIHVVAATDSVRVPVSVQPDAAPDVMPEPAVQRVWANATRGQVVSTIDSLAAAVRHAAKPRPVPLPWHPMRSPWWMLPFALALGGEWWLRRRSGRA